MRRIYRSFHGVICFTAQLRPLAKRSTLQAIDSRANRLLPREDAMALRTEHILALWLVAVVALAASSAFDQTVAPTNSLPNPYRAIEHWAKMPEGRTWGSTSGVDSDPGGVSVWVLERCGAQGFIPPSQMKEGEPFNCDGSKLAPILKFDASGKLVRSFGEELLVFPHGLHVDREGNV